MDNKQPRTKQWSKEEIIAGIQECAAKLGKVPTLDELERETGINEKTCRRRWGNYTKALRAAGFEGRGPGFQWKMEELFTDWANLVRKLGAIPRAQDYYVHCRFSLQPLRQRFEYLNDVPAGMVQYAVENGLEEEWSDVLEIARRFVPRKRGRRAEKAMTSNARVLKDRPLSGAPLLGSAMAFAPVNEMGVVYLFGTMASKLGFLLTYIGAAYPDGQAYREVEPGRWQFVRIEFEFQSRNFLHHFHDPNECDLIVCWEHNWGEAPVEVLELKQALSTQQSALSQTQNL